MVVPAKKILHVVLANKPRMLREMLGKLISRSSRVKVIGEETNARRLPLIIELFRPDWVVLNLMPNGSLPGIVEALQDKYPDLGILAITENAGHVCALRGNIAREGLVLEDLVSLGISQHASFNSKDVVNHWEAGSSKG